MLRKRPKRPTMDDLNRVRDEAHAWRASFAQEYGASHDVKPRLAAAEDRIELVLKTTSSGYRELAERLAAVEEKQNSDTAFRNLITERTPNE